MTAAERHRERELERWAPERWEAVARYLGVEVGP